MLRFFTQHWARLLVCGGLLFGLGIGASVHAQPAPEPLTSLSEVHTDEDGDYVPDRLGDTVRVAGHATVATDTFDDEQFFVFIQNAADSTGLKLFAQERPGPDIARGDSVIARGVVSQYQGATQLNVLDYEVADRSGPAPPPIPLTVAEANRERYEGVLARVEGRIINRNANQGGQYLLINAPGGSDEDLMVFASNYSLRRFGFDDFEIGDRIAVTGVLTQYDFEPPYDEFYEILPRSADDMETVGLTRSFIRRAIVGGGLLLLLAIGAALLFRRQVKRRTQELAESEARFRHLAEASFEGIVFHNAGHILDVNDVFAQLTGYARGELIDEPLKRLLESPSDELLHGLFQNGDDSTQEGTMVRKGGSTFPAELRVRTLPYDGKQVRVVVVRDITQRKRHEAEILAAKEQAEAVAELKSNLLHNMSHELRTPITSIVGYAELILDRPPDKHDKYARLIRQSGQRLFETLNSVLEMAQIESGTLAPVTEETDVADLAQEVVELHRGSASDESVTLQTEIDPDVPSLDTDRRLVYRILNNLVNNAVKFTDEGTVTVRVTAIDEGLQIEVEDTGVGIDEEFLPHLFDAFKQESKGLGRDYEGTGLGLAITKHMVDLLDGTIDVESVKGAGSIFTVVLPDGIAPEESPEAIERDAPEAAETPTATPPTPS